jgi:hypothetical protein
MARGYSQIISRFEISRLASLNWQKDGCPPGRDLDYFIEAESLLKATRRLLSHEEKAPTNRKTKGATLSIKLAAGKLSVRPVLK